MTEREEYEVAKRLPKGALRALLAMTTEPTLPGRDTFNANAAFNLTWKLRSYGGIANYRTMSGRAAFYLTPIGERIKAQAKAIEARRAATPQSGAVGDESAVGKADLPNTYRGIR